VDIFCRKRPYIAELDKGITPSLHNKVKAKQTYATADVPHLSKAGDG
jgi:hypothetical protein